MPSTMTFLMELHLIGLLVTLWSSSPSLATPLPFNISLEGSAEGEELDILIDTPSPPATSGPASESSTTSHGSTHVEHFLLSQMVHFLQDNLFLILVLFTLFITIFLILCCAYIMSRKRKINAYYPSSFPSKMYLPEKPSNRQQAEPVDSSKKLHHDIMKAASGKRGKRPHTDIFNEAQHSSCPEQSEILPEQTAESPSGQGHSQAQHEKDRQEDSTVTPSIPLITGEKTALLQCSRHCV
uniref:Transmembrane protein 119 n=1 Tax=Oncorhynchus tshawytscha TaxID=74940 RepID=A0A8C8IYP7_ONCTS